MIVYLIDSKLSKDFFSVDVGFYTIHFSPRYFLISPIFFIFTFSDSSVKSFQILFLQPSWTTTVNS